MGRCVHGELCWEVKFPPVFKLNIRDRKLDNQRDYATHNDKGQWEDGLAAVGFVFLGVYRHILKKLAFPRQTLFIDRSSKGVPRL